ncbi:MAG: UDP-N-acetylmuramoyl-L-alanine--D-glutamate ligase [Clostridiales bacterium]|nr:UDP-N-acetylmuramoyl-L-alanine--D-glutamate ligase [Clostridiales bacterium]
MSAENLIEYIKDKKILILGFGREGKSTYNFIRKHLPEKPLTVGDKNGVEINDENVTLDCGEDYLKHLDRYDIVVKSPGIPFIGVSYPDTTEITCQTDLFLRFADCKMIGVTGTKGKTTTSTLIYEMLKAGGADAYLMGNVGVPVLESMELGGDSAAVIELSSHQLEFTRKSPHIAVLTNVYEEHLDHYEEGFKGYVNAKLNIVKNQGEDDYFIYNGVQGIEKYTDESKIKSQKIKVCPEGDEFVRSLFGINKHLKGTHNNHDIAFAAAAAKCFGVSEKAVRAAVENFKGIPNRMEYFGTFGGVEYYNDAIATIPEAAMRAVEALGNVGTLIIGGLDRGIDYSGFVKALAKTDIDNICLL